MCISSMWSVPGNTAFWQHSIESSVRTAMCKMWCMDTYDFKESIYTTYVFPSCGLCLVLSVCCSVLQCLQCVAVCCSVLQCVAVCCSVLQCATVCCSVLQCAAVCCSVLQYVAFFKSNPFLLLLRVSCAPFHFFLACLKVSKIIFLKE